MKNFYIYLLVRWKIKARGSVYFKTKPDRLYVEISQSDISEREATECLYILSKLLYHKIINSYDKTRNEIGICAFDRKTVLGFDLFLIGNIVYPALSAGIFVEEYDNVFFLVTIKDKYKFIIRKEIKQDIKILKYTFIHDEYGKYLPDIKDKIVLDIGGYIGDTAIYFSNLGASMVYVYEPHPVLYQILAKNIELNNLKNVITINCGASNENSIIFAKEDNFYNGPTGAFGSKLSREREGKRVEMKAVSFKEIIENIGEIDFVKMDCEGCEFQVLLSCGRLHLKRIRKMVVEYHSNPEKIIKHLEDSGFFVDLENSGVFIEGGNDILVASLL
jgi:FkbM family methyltransferase